MSTLKATFFFLLVLLLSCNARHFERTDEDSATGALNAQEEKRDETMELRNSAGEEMMNMEDDRTRRLLESNSNKRQDDMPGVRGRSIQFEDMAQKNGDDLHSNTKEFGELEDEDKDQSDSLSVLTPRKIWKGTTRRWERGIDINPPGLWGRAIKNNSPGLWGGGIHNYPPGLWGRGLQNNPPGLWGREFRITSALSRGIRNGPIGLWGREIRNGPIGLWGRGLRNGPPGLWGREIRNGLPGRNGPPGLWGRDIEKDAPVLKREIFGMESTGAVDDEGKEDVNELK